jgi:hypothetical protein
MGDLREKRLKVKLELRDFKLSALLDVTRAINSKLSEQELLEHYSKALSLKSLNSSFTFNLFSRKSPILFLLFHSLRILFRPSVYFNKITCINK